MVNGLANDVFRLHPLGAELLDGPSRQRVRGKCAHRREEVGRWTLEGDLQRLVLKGFYSQGIRTGFALVVRLRILDDVQVARTA